METRKIEKQILEMSHKIAAALEKGKSIEIKKTKDRVLILEVGKKIIK